MSRKDFLNSLKIRNSNFKKYTGKKLDFDKLKSIVQKKIAVGLMSAIIITGFGGCAQKAHEDPTINTPSTSQSTTMGEYDHLDSPDAFLQDFKERYVKAYNKEHGTNYAPSQIKLDLTTVDYLYKTENGLVTHGGKPYETQDELDKFGDYSTISASIGYAELYQIIDKDTDKAIESYAKVHTENGYIEDKVFSGNDLDSLLDKLNKNDPSILENYIGLYDTVIDICNDGYVSSDSKDSYIAEIEALEESTKTTDENVR